MAVPTAIRPRPRVGIARQWFPAAEATQAQSNRALEPMKDSDLYQCISVVRSRPTGRRGPRPDASCFEHHEPGTLLLLVALATAGLWVTRAPYTVGPICAESSRSFLWLRRQPLLWQQDIPRFRGGVDIIRFTATVLDKDRHPVTGLTAADFEVRVDGKPRPLAASARR